MQTLNIVSWDVNLNISLVGDFVNHLSKTGEGKTEGGFL